MINKKIVSGILAGLMLVSSSVTALASDKKYSSKEKDCKKIYSVISKIKCDDDKKDSYKNLKSNISEALKKASYKAVNVSTKKEEPKNTIKQEVPNPDVNKLSKESVSEALKKAMEKAQQNKISQDELKAIKDQIKAEYETQRAIEKTNKELLEKAIEKQKQVKGYIARVAKGELIYTDEQLSQIDVLSDKLQADVQAVIDKSAAIKTAKEATKASMAEKDYATALTKLKQETAVRQERTPALTAVNEDLDGILAILAKGQAVTSTTTIELPGEAVEQ